MRKLITAGLVIAAILGAGAGVANVALTATTATAELQTVAYVQDNPSLDEMVAAEAIAQRIAAHQPVLEDWTWIGAPDAVGRYNDALLEAWEDAGEPDAAVWLDSYAQPGKDQAAQLISQRLQSGQRIAEDWTWAGAPAVVGDFNDALIGEWEAAGRPDVAEWLSAYPRV